MNNRDSIIKGKKEGFYEKIMDIVYGDFNGGI